jgi:hypothetical protein
MEEQEPTGKAKSIWKCPKCDKKVTLFVRPSEPPICTNPTAHSTAVVVMEQLK